MSRDTAERMRSVRVRTSVPVVIRGGSTEERCEAVEIAPGGVFVASPRLRPLFQLLALRIELPDREPLQVLGMVARRVEPEEAALGSTPPGLGIRFYGLRPETQKTWHQFVKRKAAEALRERAEALAARSGLDPRMVSAALQAEQPEPEPAARSAPSRGPRSRAPSSIEAELLAEALARAEEPEQGPAGAPACSPIYVIGGSGPVRQRRSGVPPRAEKAGERDTLTDLPAVDRDDELRPARAESQAETGLAAPLSSWGLAPAEPLAHVVYRIELPSMAALQGFEGSAIAAGGVMVRTGDVHPPGTLAVICVVHPESRDEFHLPGTVVEATPDAPGVAVAFSAVTPRTLALFRDFISLGTPIPRGASGLEPEAELAMVHAGSELEHDEDFDDVPRDTAEINMEDVLPILSEPEPGERGPERG